MSRGGRRDGFSSDRDPAVETRWTPSMMAANSGQVTLPHPEQSA